MVVRALDRSGVGWCVLGDPATPDAPEGTIDLRIERAKTRQVEAILEAHRFMRLPERNRRRRASFAAYHRPTDQWVHLRIHAGGFNSPPPAAAPATKQPSRLGAAVGRLARCATEAIQVALPRRNPGMTVALLGPDGCGKSTLVSRIEQSYCLPVRTLYMGLWQQGKNPGNRRFRLPGWSLSSRLLRVWRQYLVGQYHRRLGRLVLFDRYTYDALLPHPGKRGASARLYAWVLGHACPGPDLTLVLSVPGQVMYARKRESSPEQLEMERQGFLSLRHRVPRLQIVDATRPRETVHADVVDRIWSRYFGRW